MEEISPQDAPPPIWKGASPSVCSKSDTKHELKDSTTYGLLETFIYVSIVKCGN
ncbi:hypothetical protein I79_025969 [Cricetulus griseus]|uniref:Uncharacterized protein n=1 Tax=Cricetulus griseus TaxID=10029 RepID=G3IPQ0_CRIGR|nr:hypothetical protein I79_025969 [Cricetulus griseus]